MAFKTITTTEERINWREGNRMITISGAIKSTDDKFTISAHCREEGAIKERQKALIVVIFPDGDNWQGTIDDLSKKLKKRVKQ